MEIKGFSLQHYRNVELARFEFNIDRPVFLVGKNGQGKSNLLEGLGLVTAIRSFRTYESSPLIMNKKRSAHLIYKLIDDQKQETEVELKISSKKRSIKLDDLEIKRLSEYVGLFPSVVFSADDTQLIKSGPQLRRRFFDLLFSIVDPEYLVFLQNYHRALKERNNALKSKMDRSVVTAYDKVVARHGSWIINKRKTWLEKYLPLYVSSYQQISTDQESGEITYHPSLNIKNESEFLEKLENNYPRDSILGSTTIGPHRDDFVFSVEGFQAKTHASDGQQRCLVLALKLGQIDFIKNTLQRTPVVLLDDILGELDSHRKDRFWSLFDHQCQIFASGTSIPKYQWKTPWDVYSVDQGKFTHIV